MGLHGNRRATGSIPAARNLKLHFLLLFLVRSNKSSNIGAVRPPFWGGGGRRRAGFLGPMKGGGGPDFWGGGGAEE